MRSKSDKYGEVVRLDADALPPHYYAIIWPDGSLEEIGQNPIYPPTRVGYWCMTSYRLSQDEVTREFTAFIDVIDAADRSIVDHFERPLPVKSRGYAIQHTHQAIDAIVKQLGYAKVVDEDSITWEEVE